MDVVIVRAAGCLHVGGNQVAVGGERNRSVGVRNIRGGEAFVIGQRETSAPRKSCGQVGKAGVDCDASATGDFQMVGRDECTTVNDIATGSLKDNPVGCRDGDIRQVDRTGTGPGGQLDVAACVGDCQLRDHVATDST